MSSSTLAPRVFISVAEQSADEHAAALINAFRRRHPEATFSGLAGPAMQAAGCHVLHDMTTRSAMAGAAFGRVPEALRILRQIKTHLQEQHYDAAVVVDSPTLNLPIAKHCQQAGVPVLYYIAPQTWAWAPWRNGRIRKRVDRIACIWPFEEKYFRSFGIPATYVGHPSFDHLEATPIDSNREAALRKDAGPVIALLPGSREHVVKEILPGQLEIARAIQRRHHRARFLIVAANPRMRELIENTLDVMRHRLDLKILEGESERGAAIRAADLVLVASGTVTLEVAYHATPMIVMYNANRWLYHLVGRWLITTPYFSIPNILANRQLVPEFMPYYRSTTPIIARAMEWLATPASLTRVRNELKTLLDPIKKTGAADNAASELEQLLAENRRLSPSVSGDVVEPEPPAEPWRPHVSTDSAFAGEQAKPEAITESQTEIRAEDHSPPR